MGVAVLILQCPSTLHERIGQQVHNALCTVYQRTSLAKRQKLQLQIESAPRHLFGSNQEAIHDPIPSLLRIIQHRPRHITQRNIQSSPSKTSYHGPWAITSSAILNSLRTPNINLRIGISLPQRLSHRIRGPVNSEAQYVAHLMVTPPIRIMSCPSFLHPMHCKRSPVVCIPGHQG
ncbi:hypothetical protein FA15DRAFT_224658 [Coprinopsis marcescibilis]|uniref:Uncharacterized protein n=1 Tax=Coprinopsis marcescibilis TaxID=230819 RepID=A0A5C3KH41_COPMA|nr:hypothetical protein FA15DRAFT_224658 [Coprinopsis marcescibilis]